jgi:hypothetical protein
MPRDGAVFKRRTHSLRLQYVHRTKKENAVAGTQMFTNYERTHTAFNISPFARDELGAPHSPRSNISACFRIPTATARSSRKHPQSLNVPRYHGRKLSFEPWQSPHGDREKRRAVDLVGNEASGSVAQTDTDENQSRLSDKVKTTTARNDSFIGDEEVAQNTDDEIQALSFRRHRSAAALSPVPSPRSAVYKRRCSTSVIHRRFDRGQETSRRLYDERSTDLAQAYGAAP